MALDVSEYVIPSDIPPEGTSLVPVHPEREELLRRIDEKAAECAKATMALEAARNDAKQAQGRRDTVEAQAIFLSNQLEDMMIELVRTYC